jgi:hypothetical protein
MRGAWGYKILVEILKGIDHLGDIEVDRKIILKWIRVKGCEAMA